MLLVPTYLGRSRINGTGLFSSGPIPKGGLISRWNPRWGSTFSQQEALSLPAIALKTLIHFGWLKDDVWYLEPDNGKFTNHSRKPNCISNEHFQVFAARDIFTGEELTEDYRTFCEHCVAANFGFL